MAVDWDAWHDDYDDPGSFLSRRLRVVQEHVRDVLAETTPSAVSVLSACAGDGRDVLELVGERDDASRVSVVLVETDDRNADRAEAAAAGLGLASFDLRRTDAGTSDAYVGAVPADLVLLCGIFGNISDADVERTVAFSPQLCRPGATLLWTRHRDEPDLTPSVRRWFAQAGFSEIAFTGPDDALFGVGAQRYEGPAVPLVAGQRLFTFQR